ncbi:amino acid ABC transporter substrate-binding protein [Bacterioplanes sanyensis]|uniref:Amino acid ABC transporter substrate-binding protein n=1 Tax=Bacterioplanes sanyensis TaxID=1249553 RepID=A0A222FPL9_9GAMM|nr:transporter substrate-binding domain-containing protein [Bacterioplanes sanyensis]ASP40662.1 amino acid ABC transporter substrate-binding protein [Bacterioplanes sanyensis]
MNKLFAITALFLALNIQAAEKLYFFTEQFPPYHMTLDGHPFAHDGENITGLCSQMVKRLAEEVPYEMKMKLRNWNSGLERVKRKANHGIFCTVRSEQREDWFEWVGPLTNTGWALFAKPGSGITLSSLEDAKQYEIGGYKGDVRTNYLMEHGFNVSVITEDAQNPRRLQLDQIDLWVSDELAGPYTASDAGDIEVEKLLTFKRVPLYLAINKDTDPKIVKALQRAADKLTKDGSFESIEHIYGR